MKGIFGMEDNILYNDKNGGTKISNDVISVISGMAVKEIEGVYSLAEDKDSEVYSNKMLSKGISVELKDEQIEVYLNMIVKYGYDVNEVAREVQLKIKDALENMIGFKVRSVNVNVSGVYTKEA